MLIFQDENLERIIYLSVMTLFSITDVRRGDISIWSLIMFGIYSVIKSIFFGMSSRELLIYISLCVLPGMAMAFAKIFMRTQIGGADILILIITGIAYGFGHACCMMIFACAATIIVGLLYRFRTGSNPNEIPFIPFMSFGSAFSGIIEMMI